MSKFLRILHINTCKASSYKCQFGINRQNRYELLQQTGLKNKSMIINSNLWDYNPILDSQTLINSSDEGYQFQTSTQDNLKFGTTDGKGNNYLLDISFNYLSFDQSSTNFNSYYYLINDVLNYSYTNLTKSLDFTGISEEYDTTISDDIYANSPLLFANRNVIKIPKKVVYTLERFTPKKLLKAVHPDSQASIEMCLLFISQLTFSGKK